MKKVRVAPGQEGIESVHPGEEMTILRDLDEAARAPSVLRKLNAVADRVEKALSSAPREVLAWEPVPLGTYGVRLHSQIRSSWVFVLRARTCTGAEKHSQSRQRMMSLRGSGDFQTRATVGCPWQSHYLKSDLDGPLESRWISIPPGVWHQGVVPGGNWAVVSFHTVSKEKLSEERPCDKSTRHTVSRKYIHDDNRRPDPESAR
jgi:hypothetical protein